MLSGWTLRVFAPSSLIAGKEEALTMVVTTESVVKRPGLSIWPAADYEFEFGSLESNGKKAQGHYEIVDENGARTIVVPDRITRIEFNDRHAVERRKGAGSTSDDVLPEMLAIRQKAIADAMLPGFSGNFLGGANAVESLLAASGSSAARSLAPSVSPSAKGRFSSGPTSAGGVSLSHAIKVEPSPGGFSGIVGGRKKSGGGAGGGGGGGGTVSPASKGDKKNRGRPKKDWESEVDKWAVQFKMASPTDVVWWGSEAKTQIRIMQVAVKDINARLKIASDMSEIILLNGVVKKLGAIVAFVEVVQQYGLDGDEFKHIHDVSITNLQLEPQVVLELPAHLLFARHKMTIRATESVERWLDRISSTAMREAGVVAVKDEQEKLFAERLAAALKQKDTKVMMSSLSGMFSSDNEYDLEDSVESFVVSFGLVLDFAGLADLDERVELLDEAVASVDATIPSSRGGGTPLGSVLATWPKGKKILDDARVHIAKGRNTQIALSQFEQKLAIFETGLGSIKTDVLSCPGTLIDTATVSFVNVCNSLGADLVDCLPEFMPKLCSGKLSSNLCAWLDCLIALSRGVLEPILQQETDAAILAEWFGSSEQLRARLCQLMTNTLQFQQTFCGNSKLTLVTHLWDVFQLLCSCHSFLSSTTEVTVSQSQSLQKALVTHLIPLSPDLSEWAAMAMDGILKSNLMADTSPLLLKINEALSQHGCQTVQGLRSSVEDLLTPAGGSSFSVRDASDEVLKALANKVLTEDVVLKANELALLTADTLLLQQVHYFHAVLLLVILLAKAEVVVREILCATKMSDRAISDMQADTDNCGVIVVVLWDVC